uniref:Tn3 family transposase n=1 Tax=Escherichia coli TaxID=562 RepID=UPI001BF067DE|nr:Mobile element protein [Escherichia coli]
MALRELGGSSTLFIWTGCQSVELRRRVHAGLNKGEARNSLAGAVFFNRQKSGIGLRAAALQASGLTLVTAAIVLWNTVCLERATQGLVEPASRWTASCCNFCRRWAGSTSTNRRLRLAAEPQTGDRKFRPTRMPGKP